MMINMGRRLDVVGLASQRVIKGTNEVRLRTDVTNTGGVGQNFAVIWHLLDSAGAVILEDSNTVYLDKGNMDTYRGKFTIAQLNMVPDGIYSVDVAVWNDELTEMYDGPLVKENELEIVSPTDASLSNFQVEVVF